MLQIYAYLNANTPKTEKNLARKPNWEHLADNFCFLSIFSYLYFVFFLISVFFISAVIYRTMVCRTKIFNIATCKITEKNDRTSIVFFCFFS